jgi:amino acid transporter
MSNPTTEATGLRAGSVRTGHLVFFVVAAAAPLTVLAGFAPLTFLVGGQTAPVGYLVAGLVYLLFAVGFTTISRHVRNTGAFYGYIRAGLGAVPGGAAALLAYAGYALGQIGFCAAAGLFASNLVELVTGAKVSWGICALVIALAVGALAYAKVEVGARVLAVLLVAEIGILFVLAGAILLKGAPDGLSLAGFNPGSWTLSALGPLFVLTFIVYIGFEQTAVYSEECDDPRTAVPRATYIAVVLLAVVYTFISWVILMGIGASNLEKVLSGDLSAVVFDVNTQYLGTAATDVLQVLIVTSFLAGVLALQNASSRYLFALGRDGLLPRALGGSHPRTGSPATAVVVQTVIVVAAIAAFALGGFDPYLQVVIWTNTPTLVAVLLLQIATSVAVVAFFGRNPRGESVWHRLVAPALSAVVLLAVLVLVCAKLSLLTALGVGGNLLIMLPLVVAAVVGAVRGASVGPMSAGQLDLRDHDELALETYS